VVFSGATGGVGSVAVSILTKEKYDIAAVNGIVDEREYLLKLGAKTVISIEEATDASGRPAPEGALGWCH
jgi:acrylyl-CoA reductase (NADPH)